MQSEKKTSVLVWASVAAAAAGIAVVAVLIKCRDNNCSDEQNSESDHRHLKQVLSDCYNKINEIEARLPAVPEANIGGPKKSALSNGSRAASGKPVS